MKNIYLTVALLSASLVVNAQTGPGGVGSAANALLWLDANQLGLANGSMVTSWTDISGGAHNANQGSTALKPIFRTAESNGFPAIDFDGANDFLKTNPIAGFNADVTVSYILVMKQDVLGTSSNPYTNSYGTSTTHFQGRLHGGITTTSSSFFSFSRVNSTVLIKSNHSPSLGYNIHSAVLTGTGITTFTDGTQIQTSAGTAITPATHNFFQVGRRPYINDLPYNGKIAEVIAYDDNLTNTQRILVENYLSSKYAIAMTSNDHYAMEASGHYFTVTGIGMEGGNSVTDAEGRSLVQINTASALANGDYLLWGSDNASLTVNTTNVPSQFAAFTGSRLNRTWRIDETGDVGTYSLAINMATMPALGPDTGDYVLMIDDDGDFSNGGTTYHSTGYSFAGNIATWTGVDLPDGAFFTVAYVPAIFSITTGVWNDITTWNCNCIPTNADDVFISANDVVTVDGFAETSNFSIVATGTLDFSGLNQLAVSGDFDNQGTFIGTSGRLTMNGGATQFMNSSSAVTFEEFEVNNSFDVSIQTGDYTISSIGTYFPTEGNLDVSGANSFTFDSDASGSGRIDQFTATSSIIGSVIFKRFISAGTGGYRDLASPLSGGSTVSSFDDDMFISGETSDGFADGCAYSNNECFYSFKFFIANTYTDITTAATNIPNATRGVHAWVSDSYPTGLAAPVIIDLTGSVNGFGSIVASATGANTFTTIGNPYISQIDFDELDRSNIGDFYYVWDVNINNYNWYQIGNGSSPLTEVLASGQGFVVMPETGFGTVTFNQDDKTSNPATFIRSETSNDFFRLALNRTDKKYSCDVTFNMNSEASNGFDRFDIPTPMGMDPDAIYISAKADDRNVRCFGMNNKETSVSVPLVINVPAIGSYSINTKNLEIYNQYTCVILEDMETGSRYDLRNISEVRFNIEKTGQDDARFMVHFSNDACSQMVAGIDINDNESTVEMTNFNEYVKVDMNFASSENVTISFYNMLGQNVLSEQHQNVSSKSVNVNVPSSLKNGVYLVVVETNKKRYTRKYNF